MLERAEEVGPEQRKTQYQCQCQGQGQGQGRHRAGGQLPLPPASEADDLYPCQLLLHPALQLSQAIHASDDVSLPTGYEGVLGSSGNQARVAVTIAAVAPVVVGAS